RSKPAAARSPQRSGRDFRRIDYPKTSPCVLLSASDRTRADRDPELEPLDERHLTVRWKARESAPAPTRRLPRLAGTASKPKDRIVAGLRHFGSHSRRRPPRSATARAHFY